MIFCSTCGGALSEGARFCQNCGAVTPVNSSASGTADDIVPAHSPQPSVQPKNPSSGCGKIMLWVFAVLVAGCAGVMILGHNASQVMDHARDAASGAPKTSAEKYETWLDKNSLQQLGKVLDAVNQAQGAKLFTSFAIGPQSCSVTVDADIYQLKSEQDKNVLNQLVGALCTKSYRRPFGDAKGDVRNVPESGLHVEIDDLSGSALYHDLWTRK